MLETVLKFLVLPASVLLVLLFPVQIDPNSHFLPFPSVDSGNADKYISFKLSI